MDAKLYDRVVKYARNISSGGELPWQGLYTARSVYKVLKKSKTALSPEKIAEQIGISSEYANQIILALQNGGIPITSEPGKKSWTGRPKSEYFLR